MDLFASEENVDPISLLMPNADVTYFPNFLSTEKASEAFNILKVETHWKQDDIKLFGKIYPQPRLTALFGNNDKSYSYSGITMFPKPFTPTLKQIKIDLEDLLSNLVNNKDQNNKIEFTTVLANLYRDGNDSNGWHSDDEKELGHNPLIASLSLGTNRWFHFKHKKDKNLRYKILLEHGSLLLMKGTTQEFWQHQLPKSKKVEDSRINLTFRIIK